MCDCKSYNKDIGSRPEVIIPLPDGLATHRQNRTVCIDACIAETIRHLWSHRIETLGCCCGHGKEGPSLIISEGYQADDYLTIRNLIADVDLRKWNILQWQLCTIDGSTQ